MKGVSMPVYSKWRPLSDLPLVLYLEAIHDDYEGLRFLLREGDPTARCLRIRFDSVVAYLNSNESYRSPTWIATQGTRPPTTLLTIKGSPLSDFVLRSAGGVVQREEITHYGIYTPEDCVDVIALAAPTVEWL